MIFFTLNKIRQSRVTAKGLNCSIEDVSLTPTYRKPPDVIFESAKREGQIWIDREVKQFELPPLPTGKYGYRDTYAGRPISLLSLEIREYTDLRKNWNDTQHRKLEEAIAEFVATLMKTAVVLHRRTEDRRREQREKQERIAAYEKLQMEVQQEKRRVDDLLKMTENWKGAQTIRDFLSVYRNLLETDQQPIESGSELEKWLDWAEQQADRFDPLVQSPPSILDRAHELLGHDEEDD